MNIPCPVCNPCDELNPPYINLTSEAQDVDHCFGIGSWPYDPPIGGHECNQWWCISQCKTEEVNGVCQDDPNQCALNNSLECNFERCDGGGGGGGGGDNPTGFTIYFNKAQRCTATCPDGSKFTYTVRAGLIANTSQVLANRSAHSLACIRAEQFKICLSSFPESCCINQTFNASIHAQTTVGIQTWHIDPGLPPGLYLAIIDHRTLNIYGTPTADGPYDFDVTAIDTLGNSMRKTYSLCVVKITPDSGVMPDAAIGTAYNEPLNETLCTPLPKVWSVVSGSLPAGLTMAAATGLISGTPTGPAGTYTFTVELKAG